MPALHDTAHLAAHWGLLQRTTLLDVALTPSEIHDVHHGLKLGRHRETGGLARLLGANRDVDGSLPSAALTAGP